MGCSYRAGRAGRQPHEEDRACPASIVVRRDRSAVRLDEMTDDCEAEAEAADGTRRERFATAERLEDVRQKLGVDSQAPSL